ncbi:MAG: sigma 54-interacting transcriptional regulator [Polyangia bacterium]|jgi:PAS domain S-box-containing protein|nr:sigma 54-interacting transcriptional regulator [Polyangia bacterium]
MPSTKLTELYPLILDSIDQGVFTVDHNFVVTSFNAAAERIVGISREAAIGKKCHHVFRASICETDCALRRTLESGIPLRGVRIDVLNSDMEAVPITVSTAVLRDRDGGLLGGVELFRDVSELEALRRHLSNQKGFAEIIGASPPMREIFRLLPDVAASEASVVIEGPSGSGKELVAQAIHRLSPRRELPFIRINCGALPDSLLESELFGYVRGAFTDARRDKPGRFLQAHGGTLFLDEIGDVSPAFQAKLLRVLQDGELTPLGDTKPVVVDVRVISATNRDLKQLVAKGEFREDLFYRLRVVPIFVPPLADRREDIPLIVDHYVGLLGASTGKPIHGLTDEAMAALKCYSFPGNVRELRNILEHAFVLCHGGLIDKAHLLPEVSSSVGPLRSDGAWSQGFRRSPKPSERKLLGNAVAPSALVDPRARALAEALEANQWNRTKTASALGIARNTLWRRMRELGFLGL